MGALPTAALTTESVFPTTPAGVAILTVGPITGDPTIGRRPVTDPPAAVQGMAADGPGTAGAVMAAVAVGVEAVDAVSDHSAQPSIRLAAPSESVALTELASRAKAHWGYSAAFLSACRAELTINEGQCKAGLIWVAECSERLVGFYAVRPADAKTVELDGLYVDPTRIGRGVGRALTEHAVNWARDRGFRRMSIQSDPYAAGFYRKCGARPKGTRP